MKTETLKPLKVDRTKLYTPSEYGRKVGESIQMVRYWMAQGKLEVVEINGARLVYDV